MTLLARLTGAMAPHLGAAVARERAAQIAMVASCGDMLDADALSAIVGRATQSARYYHERVPTRDECVAAAVAACEVLRAEAEAA